MWSSWNRYSYSLQKNYFALTFFACQLLLYIEEDNKGNKREEKMDFDFLLMQKVKNGDREAGEQFIKKYYPAIYQYCFLQIHNRIDAEDLTQDVFVRFFESLETYKEFGKVKNYLYCIAGNTIKNYFKKKREVLLDELPETEDCCMENVDIRMDIEQTVDGLPDEIKEVTILFFFQGLKQREIAELLDIKLSLVKYRIGKAKQILSENLEVRK